MARKVKLFTRRQLARHRRRQHEEKVAELKLRAREQADREKTGARVDDMLRGVAE